MTKRIIFSLIYKNGHFMMSRNFRLQSVGNIDWLLNNYNIPEVSRGLDEILILNTAAVNEPDPLFLDYIKRISRKCFIPIAVGGGIENKDVARAYMMNGADKLVINRSFFQNPAFCQELTEIYGRQSIIASVDFTRDAQGTPTVYSSSPHLPQDLQLAPFLTHVQEHGAGEILLQSVQKDGTGMGLDLEVFKNLSPLETPCILMGGVGKGEQIVEGLQHAQVDAVATANLFNFIGSAFLKFRASLTNREIEVPQWGTPDFKSLENSLSVQK